MRDNWAIKRVRTNRINISHLSIIAAGCNLNMYLRYKVFRNISQHKNSGWRNILLNYFVEAYQDNHEYVVSHFRDRYLEILNLNKKFVLVGLFTPFHYGKLMTSQQYGYT